MTYKTADYIRSMILAISIESHNDDLGCSCIQSTIDADEWECHLYSKSENWSAMTYLEMLALNIVLLAPNLIKCLGTCDIGRLKGEKVVSSVVIW